MRGRVIFKSITSDWSLQLGFFEYNKDHKLRKGGFRAGSVDKSIGLSIRDIVSQKLLRKLDEFLHRIAVPKLGPIEKLNHMGPFSVLVAVLLFVSPMIVFTIPALGDIYVHSEGIYAYRDNQGVVHFSRLPDHLRNSKIYRVDNMEVLVSPKGNLYLPQHYQGIFDFVEVHPQTSNGRKIYHIGNRQVEVGADGKLYIITQRSGDGPIGALLLLIILVIVIAVFLKSGSKSHSPISSSHGDSGYESNTGEKHDPDWPWRDKEVIIGQKNVYEKGRFHNTKIGRVQENIFSTGKTIYEGGVFSSKKVGKVETNLWGTPKSVVDKWGNKVGDIKTTWSGRRIIVDEDGNEIGEYKDG